MAATQQLLIPTVPLTITWEKLPENYQLDEEPVEDTGHPLIAAALRESLELADFIKPDILIASNLGICATINGNLVIKAPDWFYAAPVQPIAAGEYRKSYTPHLEGTIPSVVIEFLSHTDGGEYSSKPTYPPGKWHFYEQILKVPNYVIFDPKAGLLEMYRLEAAHYQLEMPDEEGCHWIAEIGLFLGPWRGTKGGQSGYWLRWWDQERNLLPWGVEQISQVSQQLQQANQRAEQLAAYLRSQGINPDEIGS